MQEYLFIAEAVNGNIIKQTPEDKSQLNPNKSAFYDVMQNLPLKTFSLVGKGHVFTVDFTDLSIALDDKKQYCPRPPVACTLSPIYYCDTVEVLRNTLAIDKTLITKLVRRVFESKHEQTLKPAYHIGFQMHYKQPVNGKKNAKYVMTIQ